MRSPRVLIYVAFVAVVLVGGIFLYRAGDSAKAAGRGIPVENATVVLGDQGFEPRDITVKAGGTVTFTTNRGRPFWPASDPHPSHSIYPEFDPRAPIMPDGQWTFTFNKIGDWGYHDHLRSYFIGTVHVVK